MIINRLRICNLHRILKRHFSSSRKPNPQESIRNIGILAHIDAGEKILLKNKKNFKF